MAFSAPFHSVLRSCPLPSLPLGMIWFGAIHPNSLVCTQYMHYICGQDPLALTAAHPAGKTLEHKGLGLQHFRTNLAH